MAGLKRFPATSDPVGIVELPPGTYRGRTTGIRERA
jgi:hypothetical protein